MTRSVAMLMTLALLGAGCGINASDQADPTSATTPAPSGTPAPSTSEAANTDVTSTTVPAEEPPDDSGRPAAPNFTLELGEGGTYSLSEGSKPVYLVFWAEW